MARGGLRWGIPSSVVWLSPPTGEVTHMPLDFDDLPPDPLDPWLDEVVEVLRAVDPGDRRTFIENMLDALDVTYAVGDVPDRVERIRQVAVGVIDAVEQAMLDTKARVRALETARDVVRVIDRAITDIEDSYRAVEFDEERLDRLVGCTRAPTSTQEQEGLGQQTGGVGPRRLPPGHG